MMVVSGLVHYDCTSTGLPDETPFAGHRWARNALVGCHGCVHGHCLPRMGVGTAEVLIN